MKLWLTSIHKTFLHFDKLGALILFKRALNSLIMSTVTSNFCIFRGSLSVYKRERNKVPGEMEGGFRKFGLLDSLEMALNPLYILFWRVIALSPSPKKSLVQTSSVDIEDLCVLLNSSLLYKFKFEKWWELFFARRYLLSYCMNVMLEANSMKILSFKTKLTRIF